MLAAAVSAVSPFPIPERSRASLNLANPGQPDLFYFHSVLVTAGWGVSDAGAPWGLNRNDDFFDPAECWAARATPEDKPLNLEHDCEDVVGHITGNVAVGPDGPLSSMEQAPPRLDLVTQAVVYRMLQTGRQGRMAELIGAVEAGEYKVSMEVLFSGIDYAVQNDIGWSVVPRTKDTAWLTKHLRAYGGDGHYNGRRLGRVLRNLVFSGKGLVKNPANPASVILDHSAGNSPPPPPAAVYSQTDPKVGEQMELKEQLEKAQADLALSQKKLEGLEGEKALASARLAEASEGLTRARAALEAQSKLTKEHAESAEAARAEAKKAAEERDALKKELDAARASIAQKDAAAKKSARAAKIKAALLCDEAKANEMADTLEALADEKFEAHLKSVAGSRPDQKALETASVKDENALAVEAADRAKKAEAARLALAKKFGYKEAK